MNSINEYKIVCKWTCMGKRMVTVSFAHSAHVMTADAWNQIRAKNHREDWNTRNKSKTA